MVDELNNACSLPADILTCPPQLSILAQSAQAGPTAQAAGFLSSGATGHKSQTYHGRWEQTPNHALGMSDLALVGPPGQVHLIMSGGCTVGATLKQGLLPLELQLGPIARWQTCGWPSGGVLPTASVCLQPVPAGTWQGPTTWSHAIVTAY